MNAILKFALQFVLGGASVVGISLVAQHLHPRYAGVIYAVPVILLVSVAFVYTEQGLTASRLALKSTLVYEVTLLYFIACTYLLVSRLGFWRGVGVALATWSIMAAVVQRLLKD